MCKIHKKTEIRKTRPCTEKDPEINEPNASGCASVDVYNMTESMRLQSLRDPTKKWLLPHEVLKENYEPVDVENASEKVKEAPAEEGVVKVSQFYASDIFCICPRCGERITGWINDPQDAMTTCDFCGLKIAGDHKISLSLY